jgi:hypothetical protein
MVVPLLVRRFLQHKRLNIELICRRMVSNESSKYLISNSAYKPFLTELGLEEENLGVFDGKWYANGEVCLFILYFSFLINLNLIDDRFDKSIDK